MGLAKGPRYADGRNRCRRRVSTERRGTVPPTVVARCATGAAARMPDECTCRSHRVVDRFRPRLATGYRGQLAVRLRGSSSKNTTSVTAWKTRAPCSIAWWRGPGVPESPRHRQIDDEQDHVGRADVLQTFAPDRHGPFHGLPVRAHVPSRPDMDADPRSGRGRRGPTGASGRAGGARPCGGDARSADNTVGMAGAASYSQRSAFKASTRATRRAGR